MVCRGLLEVQGGREGGLHQGVGLLEAQGGGLPLPWSDVVCRGTGWKGRREEGIRAFSCC